MPIDIDQKSHELKNYVGQFETTSFLGHISSLIHFIRFKNPLPTLQGLSSPQRQLFYLAGLNLSTAKPDNAELKYQHSEEEFNEMKNLLIEIETGYEQFFYPKPDDMIDDEWVAKRRVAMPTFLSYFNQGLLNYEEQIIEKVETYFKPFNSAIIEKYGLSIDDFINVYNFIDAFPNKFLNDNINPKEGEQSWEEFCEEMQQKGITPDKWQEHLPDHHRNFLEWMSDQGKMYRFQMSDLVNQFGKTKATKFLNLFTCERVKSEFLYYTEKNPIHFKPIFKIDDEVYQVVEMHQIIHSIYNTLFEFCTSNPNLREKFFLTRGKLLETKIEAVFDRFYGGKAMKHKGYYTQESHEQDLLFLYNGLALIIEAKSSKRVEPRREPDRAYPLIISNFNETIQNGYDQSYRVKSKFIGRKTLSIYSDTGLKSHVIDINTNRYNAFSIIVTLERFGQIQTDLFDLLEIYENDEYPWSVCIDDLESFLLAMRRLKMKPNKLREFLTVRQRLHSRLIASDELDVCGAFIKRELTLKNTLNEDSVFRMTPNLSDIFDRIYETQGLGFDQEKNLEMKTSGRYIPIGTPLQIKYKEDG